MNTSGAAVVTSAAGATKKQEESVYDEDLAVKPVNLILDHCLGLVLILIVARLLYELYFDYFLAGIFVVSLLVVQVWVYGVRTGSFYVLTYISERRVGPSIPIDCQRPMASALAQRKVMDQAWQLAIHATMSVTAFLVIHAHVGWDWFVDMKTLWHPCPADYLKEDSELKYPMVYNVFYIFQLAIWIWTAFSCKWLESRRKDYVEMMVHHIVTILLLFGSFLGKCVPIGMVVLFVHDASDVVLDLMKIANYFKLENAHGYFTVEICFFLNTFVAWPFFRLYYFPIKVIYEGAWLGYTSECRGEEETRADQCLNMPFCVEGNSLLSVLAVLHWWWFFLMLRIAYKLIFTSVPPSVVGAQVYEGKDERAKVE